MLLRAGPDGEVSIDFTWAVASKAPMENVVFISLHGQRRDRKDSAHDLMAAGIICVDALQPGAWPRQKYGRLCVNSPLLYISPASQQYISSN